MKRLFTAGVAALLCAGAASAEIRIAHVYGKTGPFEAYAKQSHDGLMLGLEYATDGSMEIDGEPIVVIEMTLYQIASSAVRGAGGISASRPGCSKK